MPFRMPLRLFSRPRNLVRTLGALVVLSVALGVLLVMSSPTPPTKAALSSICGNTGLTPKTTYKHVVWIWFENKARSSVIGNANAPYINSVKNSCGHDSQWMDNVLNTPSEPQYVAATAGANCSNNTLHATAPSGVACRTTDGAFNASCGSLGCANSIQAKNIFQQLQGAGKTWRAYQEGMGGNCSATAANKYAPKHNPPGFFSNLRVAGQFQGNTCSQFDVPFPNTTCNGSSCTINTTGNALLSALNNDTLPNFSFVTPNLCNDMHDTCTGYSSSVKNGDDWLKAWLPRFTASAGYQSGDTVIFVMWDEGTYGGAIPNVVIAPTVAKGKVSSTTVNNIAALKATESMLGLGYINCATGKQSNGSSCPAGSTNNLRTIFNI
jgi:hypothetical protein